MLANFDKMLTSHLIDDTIIIIFLNEERINMNLSYNIVSKVNKVFFYFSFFR